VEVAVNGSDETAPKPVLSEVKSTGNLSNANFPMDSEGRVYHLAAKKGDITNRILTVGDLKRAEMLANFLDDPPSNFILRSKRGFVIFTGKKNGVPVSIIGTGMGIAMMDFMVRESRAILDGPILIVRLGTCGGIQPNLKLGNVVVVDQAVQITRNPDKFGTDELYQITKPIKSDKDLTACLYSNLENQLITSKPELGINCSADTFYASQGRVDSNFDDRNSHLVENLTKIVPGVKTLEMETFHLMDLARSSFGVIKASACAIILAQRSSNEMLNFDLLHKIEIEAGQACLSTLANFKFE